MMNGSTVRFLALIGTVFVARLALAQPPDVVFGDGSFNTAMGDEVLAKLTTGQGNTGAGGWTLFNITSGSSNTGFGYAALYWNETGQQNTAFGVRALEHAMGDDNTAIGYRALWGSEALLSAGEQNTAIGSQALAANTGNENTAAGFQALAANTSGSSLTATGWQALASNTTGAQNTAVGSSALAFNKTGTDNVAVGYGTLYRSNGSHNTAQGWQGLNSNSSGSSNSAFGASAMFDNTTGKDNTAVGFDALYHNTTGSSNVAIGPSAGYNLTTGSNNIDLANEGLAADKGAIRIGTAGAQTQAFIAGINSSKITGSAVYVTSSGQLGVLASSERYKTSILSLPDQTSKLAKLRPVEFHLKNDPEGIVQYGLIAEEVDQVFPELVIRDGKGTIEGVRYDELAPMLLNQVAALQRALADEHARVTELTRTQADVQGLLQQLASLRQTVEGMKAAKDSF